MARTAQEEWFDAMIRHQIGLLRRAGSIRNQVLALLDATEADLRAAIRDRMRRHTGTGRPADVQRLDRLIEDVREIRRTAWAKVTPMWLGAMREIARAEPEFVAALLKSVVPVQLEPTLPSAQVVRSLVSSRPFEGKVMKEWADELAVADVRRIEAQIRIGVVQGEDIPTISRRVVGTQSLGGANGATAVTRRNAEAITRTAVNHYSNQARREFFLENEDLFDDELYVATLDAVTTPICRSLDGETFDVGEGPIPPLHYNCRSTRVATMDGKVIGQRPLKPVTERMLLREFAEREGIKAPRERAALPRGTKGRFDEYARGRTRELIGRTPAKTSYQKFLERQSVEFQDDVLGPNRGRLFRKGGLDLKAFVDRDTGHEFTLAELAKMHASAFRKAGLEPDAFLSRGR